MCQGKGEETPSPAGQLGYVHFVRIPCRVDDVLESVDSDYERIGIN